jgi:threonine dehydrogenase-like Zn-dependent dehydrogenase
MQENLMNDYRKVGVVLAAPKKIGFLDESREDLPLQPQEVRVKTLYSGISAGTELTQYRGSNPYFSKRWDSTRRLFLKAENDRGSLTYPVRNWGYEEVGQIEECGSAAQDLPVGGLVYGKWGHHSRVTLTAEYLRERRLPEGVDPVLGIFSQIGAIALNGILDSSIRLGETVAVFGLGIVGNLVGQLARLSGARVIGVDLLPQRLEKAREVGFDLVIDGRAESAAERIKTLTGGRGADVCIEASGAIPALNEAIRAVAYSSKVVVVGFYQGGAQGLVLGEEFHLNRVNLVCSQISGVSPDLQHRWNQDRLVVTFMDLLAQGRLQMQPLLSHIRPAWEAQALFDLIDRQPDSVLQAVLDFRQEPPEGLPVESLTDNV